MYAIYAKDGSEQAQLRTPLGAVKVVNIMTGMCPDESDPPTTAEEQAALLVRNGHWSAGYGYRVVRTTKTYECSDDHATEYINAATAEEAADWWLDGFDATDATQFLAVSVFEVVGEGGERIEDGEEHGATKVLHPIEPGCDAAAHTWTAPLNIVGGIPENPGVFRSIGAGTKSFEVCMACGCGRVTDTGATNPNDGTQGHTTIEYRPEYLADRTAL